MKIACWSGPRNISTALMRSWSSRCETYVTDEPFYAYYLKETGLNHPLKNEIIENYSTNFNHIIKDLTSNIPNNKKIWYQKHMAHHIINFNDLSWIKNFQNSFLIRNPKQVISSYSKKNSLKNVYELGYPQQLRIIKYLKKERIKFYVIDSEKFLEKPEKNLIEWCNFLDIKFDKKMLSWEKGPHINDGLWGKHWYSNINKSEGFLKAKVNYDINYKNFKLIYDEAKMYYKKIYNLID